MDVHAAAVSKVSPFPRERAAPVRDGQKSLTYLYVTNSGPTHQKFRRRDHEEDTHLHRRKDAPPPALQGAGQGRVDGRADTAGHRSLSQNYGKEGQAMKRERGFGSIYQPAWRDRKTGEAKQSPNWWVAYWHRGELIREPAKTKDGNHSSNRNDAVKLLKKRHGEINAGKPIGPDVEKTTFEDMAAMITDDYKANGRRSLARVEDAVNHLRDFFGDYRAIEITGDKVTRYVAD